MDQNMISCFVQSIKHNGSVSAETRNRNPTLVHRKKKKKSKRETTNRKSEWQPQECS